MNYDSKEIFGAEIQYFRTDPQYWPTLIQRLKNTGLRCVTTYVQWGTHLVGPPDKKHPVGILDFTGKTNPRLNLMKFLGLAKPGRQTELLKRIGKGMLIWQAAYVAQDKAEEESLQSITWVGGLLKQHVTRAHVHIQPAAPVEWVDWLPGGGGGVHKGTRNLGSAILQKSRREQVLFVLNHYIDTVCFSLSFKEIRSGELCNLDTDEVIPIRNGKCVVDVDRKSSAIFHVN
ncbi:MAG: beta-galactosidase [bacterium]